MKENDSNALMGNSNSDVQSLEVMKDTANAPIVNSRADVAIANTKNEALMHCMEMLTLVFVPMGTRKCRKKIFSRGC